MCGLPVLSSPAPHAESEETLSHLSLSRKAESLIRDIGAADDAPFDGSPSVRSGPWRDRARRLGPADRLNP